MKLYLVRHGETFSNKDKTVVSAGDQLTPEGIVQAETLANQFLSIPIDIVLTSPQDRAKKTAEIIAGKINKKMVAVDILREKKWPSEIERKSLEDSFVWDIFDILGENNARNPEQHYSDEENFLDTKNRAVAFIKYLADIPQDNILTVSHEYSIKIILAVMMYGDKLSYELFRDFFHFITLSNASITLCEKDKNEWHLVTLNNQQHLR